MKQKECIMIFLILVLAVCCAGMIYMKTPTTDVPKSVDGDGGFYIIDPDKKKYHRLGCPEIENIESDHITIVASLERVKEQGCKRCKTCKP